MFFARQTDWPHLHTRVHSVVYFCKDSGESVELVYVYKNCFDLFQLFGMEQNKDILIILEVSRELTSAHSREYMRLS